MTLPRSARLAACFALLLAVLSTTALAADPAPSPTAKWDPARTTAPEDVNELKALQATVQSVVDKCTPATVAVIFTPPPSEDCAGKGSRGGGGDSR